MTNLYSAEFEKTTPEYCTANFTPCLGKMGTVVTGNKGVFVWIGKKMHRSFRLGTISGGEVKKRQGWCPDDRGIR